MRAAQTGASVWPMSGAHVTKRLPEPPATLVLTTASVVPMSKSPVKFVESEFENEMTVTVYVPYWSRRQQQRSRSPLPMLLPFETL